MADILITGLSPAHLDAIDAKASELKVSRNEFIVSTLRNVAPATMPTDEDWDRLAQLTIDLEDPDAMKGARE